MDEKTVEFDTGQEDEEVYDDAGREQLLKDDEINAEEEGFMEGYDEAYSSVCAHCKKPIVDDMGIVEKEIEGEIFRFCNDDHFQEYKKAKNK